MGMFGRAVGGVVGGLASGGGEGGGGGGGVKASPVKRPAAAAAAAAARSVPQGSFRSQSRAAPTANNILAQALGLDLESGGIGDDDDDEEEEEEEDDATPLRGGRRPTHSGGNVGRNVANAAPFSKRGGTTGTLNLKTLRNLGSQARWSAPVGGGEVSVGLSLPGVRLVLHEHAGCHQSVFCRQNNVGCHSRRVSDWLHGQY
jgi:hypothetical protein